MTEQQDDKDLQQEINTENQAGNNANESVDGEDKHKQELNELNDKYLRLYSEFENYKRRVNKERVELIQTAGKDILIAMLPVIDDFERALKAMSDSGNAPLEEGVKLVHHKLKTTLESKGLKPIVSMGQPLILTFTKPLPIFLHHQPTLKAKWWTRLKKDICSAIKSFALPKVVVGE